MSAKLLNDTIYALSSGATPSGVAIIRLSGSDSYKIFKKLCGQLPVERYFALRQIHCPFSGELLDTGLCVIFSQGNSFTGEKSCEFHIHGGRALIEKVLDTFSKFENCRLAESGEFTRRAFENGCLDLTEIEGLSDLIAADTESQRIQATNQAFGNLRKLLERWRETIIKSRALIEAELDFGEEDDVSEDVTVNVWKSIDSLNHEILNHLDDDCRGEIIHDGYRVVLMGAPNAGKSSLLNALAKRDVAIVSDEAGTTRDVLEVRLNLDGYAVILNDTAGIHSSDNKIEKVGIKRALNLANEADLILWLSPVNTTESHPPAEFKEFIIVKTKDDLTNSTNQDFISCSVIKPQGLDDLFTFLKQQLKKKLTGSSNSIITRSRHRIHLKTCQKHLTNALENKSSDLVLRSEDLRIAGDQLGKLTGRIDVEDLLDYIFSEFCIGK